MPVYNHQMVFNWMFKKHERNLENRLDSRLDSSAHQDGGRDFQEACQKKYLGILESYGVSWNLEKAARDTLQNFFDSDKQTLDQVIVEVKTEGLREYIIRIQGEGSYDFRQLLHLGGTSKANNSCSAGGMGEGAKVLALVLLRDYGFSQIRFTSQDWMVDFLMDEIPEEDYVDRKKGLFAQWTRFKEPISGNFVEFKVGKREYAQAFIDARDLFYHSKNRDFANPTLEISGVGGFKFLGPKSKISLLGDGIPKGNVYVAGQRRHLEQEKWNTAEFVSIWKWENSGLRKDRDRGLITKIELEPIIQQIVGSAQRMQLELALGELEPIWTESLAYNRPTGTVILEAIIRRLAANGIKIAFDEKYLAKSLLSLGYEQALSAKGYVICNSYFSKIGMNTTSDKLRALQQHYKIVPSLKDNLKMQVLYDSAKVLGRSPKIIWVFNKEAERNIILGQYNEQFVWLAKETLRAPYNVALATYLHELDHQYGSDQSEEFSYALTNTLELVIKQIIRQPEVYQSLEKRWNKS